MVALKSQGKRLFISYYVFYPDYQTYQTTVTDENKPFILFWKPRHLYDNGDPLAVFSFLKTKNWLFLHKKDIKSSFLLLPVDSFFASETSS